MVKKEVEKKFDEICREIKSVKIQGAESVAIAGLKAYGIIPSSESVKKLLSLRATEPALKNALAYAKKFSVEAAAKHFSDSERITDELMLKLIKNNSRIFTHCHSSGVVDALIYAFKKGRKFEVFNTETRPLLQGRKTALDLARAGINVTTFVDSAAHGEIEKSDMMMIGCDAILSDGSVINKIGSGMFAELAFHHKVPVYIVTDSWKFSSSPVKIEERNFNEIWKVNCKNLNVKNPAFEKVESRFVTEIISELGILKPGEFVKKVKKTYKFV